MEKERPRARIRPGFRRFLPRAISRNKTARINARAGRRDKNWRDNRDGERDVSRFRARKPVVRHRRSQMTSSQTLDPKSAIFGR